MQKNRMKQLARETLSLQISLAKQLFLSRKFVRSDPREARDKVRDLQRGPVPVRTYVRTYLLSFLTHTVPKLLTNKTTKTKTQK